MPCKSWALVKHFQMCSVIESPAAAPLLLSPLLLLWSVVVWCPSHFSPTGLDAVSQAGKPRRGGHCFPLSSLCCPGSEASGCTINMGRPVLLPDPSIPSQSPGFPTRAPTKGLLTNHGLPGHFIFCGVGGLVSCLEA